MNKTEQVREYFREYGPSSAPRCAKATGIHADSVWRLIGDLVKTGWLVRLTRGVYEYHQLSENRLGAADMQKKMWRAIRMSHAWTQFDIAMLSGATAGYTKMYVRFLEENGYIYKVGKKGRRTLYRTTSHAPYGAPVMRRRGNKKEAEFQELKDLGWAMMRAIRDGDLVEACRMHGEIGKKFADSLGKNCGSQNGNNHGDPGY